jgi:hypothetical protein
MGGVHKYLVKFARTIDRISASIFLVQLILEARFDSGDEEALVIALNFAPSQQVKKSWKLFLVTQRKLREYVDDWLGVCRE